MITVENALRLVLDHAGEKPARSVPLADALGLILAEDVASDIDSPPHDKAMMDGYAIVAADLVDGSAELTIIEEVVAGETPKRRIEPGQATRIMTGAPAPEGADAVVMVEQTEVLEGGESLGRVCIRDAKLKAGANILPQGVAMRRGELVLSPGAEIRPCDVGLLAEVGRDHVHAIPRPRVAVLSTGNELVPPSQTPTAGQIRNSNGPMLAAMATHAGGKPCELGIGRDDRESLRRLIARGLEADILVLSGGVSAGVLDLVPSVLSEMGVVEVFHKVHLKPGKPIWFGVTSGEGQETGGQETGGQETLVFGLPGNPVSSFVCFALFVAPALRAIAGLADVRNETTTGRLPKKYAHKGNRPTFHPAVFHSDAEGEGVVEPVQWRGSADLRALSKANSLAYFPAGTRNFSAGEALQVYLL